MSWQLHTVDERVILLLSSSLPRAAQDLRRWLAGQAGEEDAGHEGESGAGLRFQVGLRKGPVEVRIVPPLLEDLSTAVHQSVCRAELVDFWPSCCTYLLLSSNKHVSNQTMLVCHLLTSASVPATEIVCWNDGCVNNFATGFCKGLTMTSYNWLFQLYEASGPETRKIHNLALCWDKIMLYPCFDIALC